MVREKLKKSGQWVCIICLLFVVSNLNAQNNLDLGVRLFNEGNYTEAKYALKKYVNDHPEDSEALYHLGRICFIQGDYEASVEYLEKLVEFKDDNSEYYNLLAEAYGECASTSGLLKKASYASKMKNAALRAVELDRESVPARFTLFIFYHRAPGIMGGSKKKAKEQADEIMARDPLQGHRAWAQIYREEKDYEKVYASYLHMLKLAKEQRNPSVSLERIEFMFNSLGYIYLRDGNTLKAIEILKKNTVEFPDSPNAWDSLAEAHMRNGDNSLAIQYYEKALAMNPRNTIRFNNLFKGAHRALRKLRNQSDRTEYVYQVPTKGDDRWQTGSLADVGIEIDPLVNMMNNLLKKNEHDLHSIIIVKDNKLVFEEYFNGVDLDVRNETLKSVSLGGELVLKEFQFDRNTLHFQASVTKSITSALVGIAIDKGLIKGMDEKLFSFFPAYSELNDGDKNDITLEHMLAMSSGIPWSESAPYNNDRNNINQLLEAYDPVRYVLGLKPFASPGKEFSYNSGTTVLLGEIVKRASGMDLADFARAYLFTPLGITSFQMLNLPNAEDTFFASSTLFLRPRDMAKFGQLYLQKGIWNSKQVISQEWIRRSLSPSIRIKNTGPWREFSSGYGYQWWIGSFEKNKTEGIVAAGFGGQFIIILPKLEMIVVFTAGDYGGYRPFFIRDIMNNYILRAVN